MKSIHKKPYLFFWIATIFLIMLSIYWWNFEDAVLDINIHDTYFIIHNSHILLLLAILYALVGLTYWVLLKFQVALSKSLTQIHYICSLIIIPIYFIGNFFLDKFHKSEFPLFDNTSKFVIFITILIFIGLIAQLFFFINVILSLFKHFYNRTKSTN